MHNAKALEELTGVNMTKMLPLPNIDDAKIPEAKKWMDKGSHLRLYRFSDSDFKNLKAVWSGTADWADGGQLEVVDGVPEGGPIPEGGTSRVEFAPQYDPTEIFAIAQKLMKRV